MLGSLLNKLTGPQASNFIKKRPQHMCFSSEFCEIFINTYFYSIPKAAAFETEIMLENSICATKPFLSSIRQNAG